MKYLLFGVLLGLMLSVNAQQLINAELDPELQWTYKGEDYSGAVVSISTLTVPKIIQPEIIIPAVITTISITDAELVTVFTTNINTELNTVVINTTELVGSSNINTTVSTTSIAASSGIVTTVNNPTVTTTPVGNTSMIPVVGQPVSIAKLTTNTTSVPVVNPTVLTQPAAAQQRVQQWKSHITNNPAAFIKDKRTIQHSPSNNPDSTVWLKWKQIYAREYPAMTYVPLDLSKVKLVAEMGLAKNETQWNNLINELDYFKQQGFNTVLLSWDGSDVLNWCTQVIKVKAMGWKVFFTFGGRERLTDEVFIDPVVYTHGLQALATVCDGYVIGWRRTSLHLYNPDDKWVQYSITTVREKAPQIPVIGEIYFGYIGNMKDGKYMENELVFNLPANVSAGLVVNFGYSNVRPTGVYTLLRKHTQVPLIALVIGEVPYYASLHANGKSKTENRRIITNIEQKFAAAGFSIATMAGDGSHGNYVKAMVDDLNFTTWSQP